ncbi:hypothetical protein F4678DRAFT_449294 [Xylaria arbuscula]|nr:hypothetical protein F4678DRAFT_449294 [Xylaria arbuscula]
MQQCFFSSKIRWRTLDIYLLLVLVGSWLAGWRVLVLAVLSIIPVIYTIYVYVLGGQI